MDGSLSVRDRIDAPRESWPRWLFRHVVVVWLLVAGPVALALTLDRALPRMPNFGAAAWTLVAARIGVVAAGIAVARRLRTRDDAAWTAVALWACAAIGVTLLERAWPELPTGLAPSEARLVACATIASDAMLALAAAWLASRSCRRAAP